MGPNCPANAFQPNTIICRAAVGVCDVAEICPGNGRTVRPTASNRLVSCVVPQPESATWPIPVRETARQLFSRWQEHGRVPRRERSVRRRGELRRREQQLPRRRRSSRTRCRVSCLGRRVRRGRECNGNGRQLPGQWLPAEHGRMSCVGGRLRRGRELHGLGRHLSGRCARARRCVAPRPGVCDGAENCDGVGNDCPADGSAASGTTCRAAADACDVGRSRATARRSVARPTASSPAARRVRTVCSATATRPATATTPASTSRIHARSSAARRSTLPGQRLSAGSRCRTARRRRSRCC